METKLKCKRLSSSERSLLMHRIYELRYVKELSICEITQETGLSSRSIFNYLHTFEAETPQIAEEMKKNGKNATADDYNKLKQEVASLKKSLAAEKLRADFYEEMVAFGKEVYGIDLKKVGTK